MISRTKGWLTITVFVAAACSVWLFNGGYNDGRPLIPKHEAPDSDAPLLGEGTASSMSLDTTLPVWSPGGVLGPSLEDTVSELDAIFKSLFHNSNGGSRRYDEDLSTAVCRSAAAAVAASRAGAGKAPELLGIVRNVTEALMAQSLRRDDDCVMHLVPHHRAICLVAAAMDNGRDGSCPSDDGGASRIPGHFLPMSQRCAFRETFCSRLLPCVQWTRGRFRVNLSGELLQEVMTQRVVPKIRRNRELFHLHQELFLHGEVANAMPPDASIPQPRLTLNMKELRWLKRRHRNQEVVINKIRSVFSEREENMRLEMGYLSKRRQAAVLSRRASSSSPPRQPPPPTLSLSTRDVFQGSTVIATAPTAESSTPFTTLSIIPEGPSSRSENETDPLPLPDKRKSGTFEYLSSLETLAVLYSLCVNSSPDARRMPCVLLMHGDSVMREFYDRLIIHVRYGFRLQESLSEEWKFKALQFQVRSTEDFVYRVFATHDEVFRLSDTFTNNGGDAATFPSYSLSEYMNAMTTAFRKKHHHSETLPPESHAFPLFHIIFVWDNKSDQPRAGLYTPKALEPAHVPLQIHGLNFWGDAIHYRMLSSLWELAKATTNTFPTSNKSGAVSRFPTSSSSSGGGGRGGEHVRERLLYIMTPPHEQPVCTPFLPSVISTSMTATQSEEELERRCPLIPNPCLNQVEANWDRSHQVIARWRKDSNASVSELRIQNCAHNSISRSLQWLLWLNDTVAKRQLLKRNAEEGQRFVINSVAVFDKGKGQFAGFSLSDRLHYGCRCQAIRRRTRYANSFYPPTIERLLSHRGRRAQHMMVEQPTHQQADKTNGWLSPFCGGNVSVKALSALLHTTLAASTREFWETLVRRAKQEESVTHSTAASFGKRLAMQAADGPEQIFFSLVERAVTQTSSNKGDKYLFAVMPSNPSKMFMFLDWLSDECRGSGDLYLLQLLLYDAMLKQRAL